MCTFNGQQCCGQTTLNLFGGFVGPAIDQGVFDFDVAFNGARGAINQLRSETGGTRIYIRIITQSLYNNVHTVIHTYTYNCL